MIPTENVILLIHIINVEVCDDFWMFDSVTVPTYITINWCTYRGCSECASEPVPLASRVRRRNSVWFWSVGVRLHPSLSPGGGYAWRISTRKTKKKGQGDFISIQSTCTTHRLFFVAGISLMDVYRPWEESEGSVGLLPTKNLLCPPIYLRRCHGNNDSYFHDPNWQHSD